MRRRRSKNSEMKLNITSLLDMFTIMLLFLLVNFSSRDELTNIHPDVDLPKSTAELDSIRAIDVILTKDRLLLDDKVVMKLYRGRFPKSALNGDQIKPFYKALVDLKRKNSVQRLRKKKSNDPHEKKHDVILFQSDKHMAFNMIDKIMMTTAQAGFEKFKFAVLQKD
jgi:biopolymer transport protein ExbD